MMKRHVRTVVLSLGFFAAPWLCADEPSAKVLLAEDLLPQLRPVLEQALKQSPRLVDKNLEVLQADANSYMAVARRYPSVGANLQDNYGKEKRADDPRGWQPTEKLNYNLSLNQPIWQWGILEAASRIGKIGQEIAQRNYAEAYRYLALEVRSAYLQLILSKMGVRNTAFVNKLAQENLKRQESRFSTNQITMGEVMAVRLAAAEASLAARRTATDFDFVLRNFRRITGIADFAEADIPDAIPGVEQTPVVVQPGAMTVLLESNGAKISELDVQRARLDYRSAQFNRYPKFSAVTSISQDQVSYTRDVGNRYQVQDLFIGLQLQWNIFDGPNTKGLRLASLTRIRQAERARDNLKDTLRQTAESEALNVNYAWEACRNAAARYRFAREGAAATRENFTRGQASQEQVDGTQAAAYGSESTYQNSIFGYLNAAAQYMSTLRADPFAQSPVQP